MSNRIGYNNIPQNGLVLDMPLDGNANARVGANGTATNVTWVKSDKGYTKQVGSFNGSSSYINIPNNALPNGNTVRTFNFWAKINTVVGDRYFMSYGNGATGQFFAPSITINNKIGFMGYVTDFETTTNATAGIRQMYTYIYNGTNLDILLDGVNIGSTILSLNTVTTYPFIIGARNYNGTITNYSNADIQLVKIYNRVLSQDEIHNLYLEGQRLFNTKPAYPQLLSGLVGYWDFKNGNLNNLVDGTLATNSGATLTTDHLGRANNAYSFNGSSSTIQNLYRQPITINPDFTISILFNTSISPINEGMSFTNYNNVSALITIGGRPTNLLVFQYRDTAGNLLSLTVTNTTFFNGQWHLLTGTKVGTLATLYLDGVSIGTLTGPIMTGHFDSGQNFLLGSRGATPFSYYNGKFNMPILLNRALTAPEVKQLYNLTQKEYIYPFPRQTTLGLTKGLVMHLDKNGNDLSGNGNNGTLTAVTPTKIGQIDGGVYNGSSSYIGPINSGITTNVTLSGIISSTNISSFYCLIGQYDQAFNPGVPSINIAGGIIYFGKAYVSNDVSYAFTPINNKPLHIVCTYDGITGKIYLDGILKAQANYTLTFNSTGQFAIGRQGTGYYANGNIYEPKIWNRALTAKEVEQEYYNTKGNFIY